MEIEIEKVKKNPRRPLTEKAKAFCKIYVENGYIARKAYMEAYNNNNESTAAIGSYQLLKDARVQTEIAYLEWTYKSLAYKKWLTKELVVTTLVEMMNATKIIINKSWIQEVVPDWNARNRAISQYSKLTWDFNEKDKNEKMIWNTMEDIEDREEWLIFSNMSTEDLEARKQKIMEKLYAANGK